MWGFLLHKYLWGQKQALTFAVAIQKNNVITEIAREINQL